MTGRHKANGAAERTTGGSYRTFVDNTVTLQERNVRFALEMVDGSIREFRRQAASNRIMFRKLVEHTGGQQSVLQTLVGKSIDAYADLLFAPLCYYREALRSVAIEAGDGSLPLENYNELTVEEVSKKRKDLSGQEVWAIRSYEKQHKNRIELLERLDRALV